MKKTPLKAKQSLRASYQKKITAGEKQAVTLRRTTLTAKTPLKFKATARTTANKSRRLNKEKLFSIFTTDLYQCHITGDKQNVHFHHIFGAANKKNSEKFGFLVPLRADWHNMSDYGIHFNRSLELLYKCACQEYFLNHYGTKEDFIKIFGKWWTADI